MPEESSVTSSEKILRHFVPQNDIVAFFRIVPIFSAGAAPWGRPNHPDSYPSKRQSAHRSPGDRKGRPYNQIVILSEAKNLLHPPLCHSERSEESSAPASE